MHRQELSKALSGGYVVQHKLDLLRKCLSMEIGVLDGGLLTEFQVEFRGISDLHLQDHALGDWERLELTEIRLERGPEESPTEEWEVYLNFWDLGSLELRCHAILVDGVPVR